MSPPINSLQKIPQQNIYHNKCHLPSTHYRRSSSRTLTTTNVTSHQLNTEDPPAELLPQQMSPPINSLQKIPQQNTYHNKCHLSSTHYRRSPSRTFTTTNVTSHQLITEDPPAEHLPQQMPPPINSLQKIPQQNFYHNKCHLPSTHYRRSPSRTFTTTNVTSHQLITEDPPAEPLPQQMSPPINSLQKIPQQNFYHNKCHLPSTHYRRSPSRTFTTTNVTSHQLITEDPPAEPLPQQMSPPINSLQKIPQQNIYHNKCHLPSTHYRRSPSRTFTTTNVTSHQLNTEDPPAEPLPQQMLPPINSLQKIPQQNPYHNKCHLPSTH